MMMKRFATACLVLPLFAACQLSTPNGGSEQPTDSVVTLPPFMSPDGVLLDVRGNVKKMTVKTTDCDENGQPTIEEWSVKEYTFDKKKRAKQVGNIDERITRNDKGQTICIESLVGDDMQMKQFLEYDEDGRISTIETKTNEWNGVKTFHYDQTGDISWTEEKSVSEGFVTTEVEQYTILERDQLGNWTKRMISNTSDSEEEGEATEDDDNTEEENDNLPADNGDDDGDDVHSNGLEIREITYRK